MIFGDQIDNITSSIVADSVEDKLFSIDKVHLCVNNNNVVYSVITYQFTPLTGATIIIYDHHYFSLIHSFK